MSIDFPVMKSAVNDQSMRILLGVKCVFVVLSAILHNQPLSATGRRHTLKCLRIAALQQEEYSTTVCLALVSTVLPNMTSILEL